MQYLKIILGIDIGSTAIKIVGVNEHAEIIASIKTATDRHLISTHDALDKLFHEQKLKPSDIEKIALTGAGASWVSDEKICGIAVTKVNEAVAIGKGALTLSSMKKALIMNIGTGTVFVHADGEKITHAGGSGLGGATLVGLSAKMLGETNVGRISKLAIKGDLSKIDLLMGDVYNEAFSNLPPDASAANFGKVAKDANAADTALGLLSMIYQVLGVMASFAAGGRGCRTIVVTGALAELTQAKHVLPLVGGLYNTDFVFCENAMYATAYGAALEII